jgi:phosphoribosylanthranilate isomerase
MTAPVARTGVKICGIRDEAALDAAAEGGADWVGFVFFARSPRVVAAPAAAALQRRLGGRATSVGLFVSPTDDEIARTLDAVPLDILQLYTDPDRAAVLRDRFGLPVWLAHGVRGRDELPRATALDGLVVEARAPDGADRPGGNGVRFDWSITRDWTAPSPWLLAGGLTPDNVRAAIGASAAPAVDVSSGVEHAPGEKDPVLIRRFIAAARGASTD